MENKLMIDKEKADAVICVLGDGTGRMVKILTDEAWVVESHGEFDVLPEIDFCVQAGFYYANMITRNYGEDAEIDWEIVETIVLLELPEATEFMPLGKVGE